MVDLFKGAAFDEGFGGEGFEGLEKVKFFGDVLGDDGFEVGGVLLIAGPLVEEGVGALGRADDVGFDLGGSCALDADVEMANEDFEHERSEAGLDAVEANVIADGVPEGFGTEERGDFLPEGVFGFEESLHEDLPDQERGIGRFEMGEDGEHPDREFAIVGVGGELQGLEGGGALGVEEVEVFADGGFEAALDEAEVGVDQGGGIGAEGESAFLEVEEPVVFGGWFTEGGVEEE